jgi:hypothetical protein
MSGFSFVVLNLRVSERLSGLLPGVFGRIGILSLLGQFGQCTPSQTS